MKNIKTVSALFVFTLICFASSGQLWVFTGNSSSFDIYFYGLGVCFIILQLFFSGARGLTGFTMPLAAALSYMTGRMIISGPAAFTQEHLLSNLIALALIMILTWVSGLYSSIINGFIKAADELILMQEKGRIQSFKSAKKEIQVELDRSRRHNHPFSMVILEPDKSSFEEARTIALADVQRKIQDKLVIGKLGKLLQEQLRGHDHILYDEQGGRFILVCPETRAKPVASIIKRLEDVAHDSLGIVFDSGAATFPEESLTLDDLMHKAGSSLEGSDSEIEHWQKRAISLSNSPPSRDTHV